MEEQSAAVAGTQRRESAAKAKVVALEAEAETLEAQRAVLVVAGTQDWVVRRQQSVQEAGAVEASVVGEVEGKAEEGLPVAPAAAAEVAVAAAAAAVLKVAEA